jgi:uncharacterized membrane protein (DUF2068 family)
MRTTPVNKAVRLVALFEACKGLLVLVAGCGLLSLLHKDVYAVATSLLDHVHLNPAAHYPQIFLEAASHLQGPRILLLALGAAVYSALRLVEAYGLLAGRAWAEMLAAASGAIYVPFEVLEFMHLRTLLTATLLIANLAVVLIMVRALLQRRRQQA